MGEFLQLHWNKKSFMLKKILFIDDEPNILKSIERMLRDMREIWDVRFVSSGAEALDELKRDDYDVIVSDVLMPQMTGLELFAQVSKLYPGIVRIILSGHFDETMTMGSLNLAHQSLHKPCTVEDIKATIEKALKLKKELQSDDLREAVSSMTKLPSLPILYEKIIKVLNSPDGSMRKVGEIISMDIGMTAKMLQLVNSAYFGLRRRINTPHEAVIYLGMEQIKALVLSVHIFSQAEVQGFSQNFLNQLWEHSFMTGMYAKRIAENESKDKDFVDAAFTAGVLHDVGKLIFITNFPRKYNELVDAVKNEKLEISFKEKEYFKATHSDIGGYLLGLWGLPDPIVETVMFHHTPQYASSDIFSPLTVVHAANHFSAHKIFKEASLIPRINMVYYDKLKCASRVNEWHNLCSRIKANED